MQTYVDYALISLKSEHISLTNFMGGRHRQKYRHNKWFVINRNSLIVFGRTAYLISKDLSKIQMDKSSLVKWNIQTKNGLYNSETGCFWIDSIKTRLAKC